MNFQEYKDIDDILYDDLRYISSNKSILLYNFNEDNEFKIRLYNYLFMWMGCHYLKKLTIYINDHYQHYLGMITEDKTILGAPIYEYSDDINPNDYDIIIGLEDDMEEIYKQWQGDDKKHKIIIINQDKKKVIINYEIENYLPKGIYGYEILGVTSSWYELKETNQKGSAYINGKELYKRIFIKKRKNAMSSSQTT